MDIDIEEDIRQDLISFKNNSSFDSERWEPLFGPAEAIIGLNDNMYKRTQAMSSGSSKGASHDDLNKILRDLKIEWKESCPVSEDPFANSETTAVREIKSEIHKQLSGQFPEWQRILLHRKQSLLLLGLGSKFDLVETFVDKHIAPFKFTFTMAPFHMNFEPRRAFTHLLWFIQHGSKPPPINLKLIPWDIGRILQEFEVALLEQRRSTVLVIHSIDKPAFRPLVHKILLPLTTRGLLLIATMDDVRAPVDLVLWNTWQYPIVALENIHTHQLFTKELMAEHWVYNKDAKGTWKYEADETTLASHTLYKLCVESSKATTSRPTPKVAIEEKEPPMPIVIEPTDMMSVEEFVTVAQNLGQRYREVLVYILVEFSKVQAMSRASRRAIQLTAQDLKLTSSQIRFKTKLVQERLLIEKSGKLSVRLARGDLSKVLEALGAHL